MYYKDYELNIDKRIEKLYKSTHLESEINENYIKHAVCIFKANDNKKSIEDAVSNMILWDAISLFGLNFIQERGIKINTSEKYWYPNCKLVWE